MLLVIITLFIFVLLFIFLILSSDHTPELKFPPKMLYIEEDAHKKIEPVHIGSENVAVGIVCIGDRYSKDVESLLEDKITYFKALNISTYILRDHLKFGKENIKQHPAKSKIPFAYWMLDNLTTNTVIIIDADVGIVNSDIDIKTFFSNEDIQIQKTKYVEGYEIMQSSIIFLRKSKNIMEMLKYVWYDSIATVRRYPGMNKIDFGEQSSLQIAIECGYFDITYKELSPHICCLNTSKCTDDYLFVHFTGSRYTDKLADIHYNFKKNRKR